MKIDLSIEEILKMRNLLSFTGKYGPDGRPTARIMSNVELSALRWFEKNTREILDAYDERIKEEKDKLNERYKDEKEAIDKLIHQLKELADRNSTNPVDRNAILEVIAALRTKEDPEIKINNELQDILNDEFRKDKHTVDVQANTAATFVEFFENTELSPHDALLVDVYEQIKA